MAFDLSPLMVPPAEREYVWWGDDAVDQERSDFVAWLSDGRSGLCLRAGQKPTVFRWAALDPVTFRCLLHEATAGAHSATPHPLDTGDVALARRPALLRAMVAYAILGLQNAVVPWHLVQTSLGTRLDDDLMRGIANAKGAAVLPPNRGETESREIGIEMLGHLGTLVAGATIPAEIEKKVSAPSSTHPRSASGTGAKTARARKGSGTSGAGA